MAKMYLSAENNSVRMFESGIMDSVSRIHWSVPLFIYIPVILFFTYTADKIYSLSAFNIIIHFAGGLFVWTLAEYVLHRFVFHYKPKSNYGQRLHFIFHGVHHDYPNDAKRLVMVPSASLPLSAMFYLLFYLVMGNHEAAPFFAGFMTGYLAYDMLHYALHHAKVKNRLLKKLRKNHLIHHFQSPDRGYGVSQPLWDYIFGTNFPADKKR